MNPKEVIEEEGSSEDEDIGPEEADEIFDGLVSMEDQYFLTSLEVFVFFYRITYAKMRCENSTLKCGVSILDIQKSKQTAPFKVRYTQGLFDLYFTMGRATTAQHRPISVKSKLLLKISWRVIMSRCLKKTTPFKAWLHLDHPKAQNKPRLLSRGIRKGFLIYYVKNSRVRKPWLSSQG